MWDLPGPGLEPVSPALAGGFLTTAPPGEAPEMALNKTQVEYGMGQDGVGQAGLVWVGEK